MDVQQIESSVRDSVETIGLTVSEYAFGQPRRLRVVIDHDSGVTVQDCVRATHAVEDALRASGFDPTDFTINVESPGAERRLTSERDFERFRGKEVRVLLNEDRDGQRRIVGVLGPVTSDTLTVSEPKRDWTLERSGIKDVRLHM
jgi:ribosome maturation factor RimP